MAIAAESLHRQVVLRYHDGSTRNALITNQESPFPDGRLIVSRTDLRGIITHCNPSFIEISGYSQQELIGQPHHLLRHPDMPASAFQDLWTTVQSGKQWRGYVKNLCKDGSHYWVYATVIPNVRQGHIVGFTSVRRKPSRLHIEECEQLYQRLRHAEASRYGA